LALRCGMGQRRYGLGVRHRPRRRFRLHRDVLRRKKGDGPDSEPKETQDPPQRWLVGGYVRSGSAAFSWLLGVVRCPELYRRQRERCGESYEGEDRSHGEDPAEAGGERVAQSTHERCELTLARDRLDLDPRELELLWAGQKVGRTELLHDRGWQLAELGSKRAIDLT